jgi:hypothetical protein
VKTIWVNLFSVFIFVSGLVVGSFDPIFAELRAHGSPALKVAREFPLFRPLCPHAKRDNQPITFDENDSWSTLGRATFTKPAPNRKSRTEPIGTPESLAAKLSRSPAPLSTGVFTPSATFHPFFPPVLLPCCLRHKISAGVSITISSQPGCGYGVGVGEV